MFATTLVLIAAARPAVGALGMTPACMSSLGAAGRQAVSPAMCDVEKTVNLHLGSTSMPPLIQVPGGLLALEAVVKPPDADVLAQWQESRGIADADSSWGSVWPAAVNLAQFIADNPSLVAGQRVAELGSGLAVAGLTAAKVGASTVTLVDREAYALHCAMSTAEVCGLRTGPMPDGSATAAAFYDDRAVPAGVVSASKADWGSMVGSGLEVDVVLASEILYELGPPVAMAVARAVAGLLTSGGTVLLADPEQGRLGGGLRTVLAEALRAMGACVSEHPIAAPPAGDAWYSLRAGDGKTSVAAPDEPTVLLRAYFEGPPDVDALGPAA